MDDDYTDYARARWTALVHSAMLLGAGLAEAEDVAQTTLVRCFLAWSGLDLPDLDDRHVLAAATTGGAPAIVTADGKASPAERLREYNLEARHPDEFLPDQLDLFPSRMLEVLVRQAAASNHPPMDLAGLLNNLERCHVPNFVEAVRRQVPDSVS